MLNTAKVLQVKAGAGTVRWQALPRAGNKRWCCGDRTHLDLSYAAFDQIAVRHRGVVDLRVRPAPCNKQGSVTYYD